MIKKILHKNIDRNKYNACVLNSKESRIYAEDWYLDAVTDYKWDCLIYGDYDAVMPLPYKVKFGIKYLYQPNLCQQLGVFSINKLDEEQFTSFLTKFKSSIIRSYQFNEDNYADFAVEGRRMDNHLLSLNSSYLELYSNFKKDRKKDIRRIEKMDLVVSDTFDYNEFLSDLKLKYPQFSAIYDSHIFKNLVINIHERERLYYRKLINGDEVISQILIAKSGRRNYLLFSSRDTDNRFKGAFAFLLNNFIKENCNISEFLDFEGSSNSGIAMFNESFGAAKKNYIAYSKLFQRII